jgi:hypothetical protein
MLREIRNTQQVPGESPRRWFFSHEQDFLVWFGDDGQPEAFQLAYSKYRDEKAILHPDGAFKAKQVLDQFLAVSKEVPKEIVDFVAARLREHPEYHENP